MGLFVKDSYGDKTAKIRPLAILIGSILLIFLGVIIGWNFHASFTEKESDITVGFITGKLEDASDLITQRLTYTSVQPVDKGKIPFINKKGFNMQYTATISAGIDMGKLDVKINDKEVKIKIPHAKVIGDADIDPNSLQFFDEKNSLFAWNTKEDLKEAMATAKKEFESVNEIDYKDFLNRADKQAKNVIHGILDDSVDGRKVIIEFTD